MGSDRRALNESNDRAISSILSITYKRKNVLLIVGCLTRVNTQKLSKKLSLCKSSIDDLKRSRCRGANMKVSPTPVKYVFANLEYKFIIGVLVEI